jgi:hypothetical protein
MEENGQFSCQLILKGNCTDKVEKVELLDGTSEGLDTHKFSTFDGGYRLSRTECVIWPPH